MKRVLSSLIVLLTLSAGSPLSAEEGATVVEGSKAASLENCVEPTHEMREHHMEYLLHQRDRTMREGIRTTKHSLAACVDCHVQRDEAGEPNAAINEEGQFCQSCHNFAAVSIDCFQCHATVPRGPAYKHPLVSSKMEKYKAAHNGSGLKGDLSQAIGLVTSTMSSDK